MHTLVEQLGARLVTIRESIYVSQRGWDINSTDYLLVTTTLDIKRGVTDYSVHIHSVIIITTFSVHDINKHIRF